MPEPSPMRPPDGLPQGAVQWRSFLMRNQGSPGYVAERFIWQVLLDLERAEARMAALAPSMGTTEDGYGG